ncbi:MAG: ATP-binding protein [Ruminococcus sp.]|nr:ATP-binding protein [Ruminococcus sp.]
MKELVIEAVSNNLDTVLAFVDEQLEEMECPPKNQMQIELAVEEIFVNIANYAYLSETGDVTVRMETDTERQTVTITFIDRGVPYDPLSKEDPDVTLLSEQREIGGLGIFLVKKTMDDVRYSHQDGMNILTICTTFALQEGQN